MCFIVLGRVLELAPVELLMEFVFCLLDVLVDLLDDLVHVLALAHLTEDVPLELEHRLFDDAVVKVNHVGLDLRLELGILVHDRLELLFAQTVAIDMMQSLVEEL